MDRLVEQRSGMLQWQQLREMIVCSNRVAAMAVVLALLAGLLLPVPALSAEHVSLPSCHQTPEDKAVKTSCQCELLRCCPALQVALQLATPPSAMGIAPRQLVSQTHPGYAEAATPPPRLS